VTNCVTCAGCANARYYRAWWFRMPRATMGQRGSAPGRARFLAGRAGGRFAHPLTSRLAARIVKGVEMAREGSLELLSTA
jgi:hypothetical protein